MTPECEPGRQMLPLIVLGGYLGAGKTTLIHRLLTDDIGLRCGVLVNDFGEVNIDERLIANQSGETMALTNGCACCSIENDLADAVERLLTVAGDLDLILIEASGVAHPDKIAAIAGGWPQLSAAHVAVAVDATDLERLLGDKFVGALVHRQIEVADQILLTKTDIADPAQTEQAFARVATVRRAQSSPVAMNCDDATLGRLIAAAAPNPAERTAAERFDGGFWSRTMRGGNSVSCAALLQLLERTPPRIERVKGFVNSSDQQCYLIQRTGSAATIAPWERDAPTEVMVIGSGAEPRLDETTRTWLADLQTTLGKRRRLDTAS